MLVLFFVMTWHGVISAQVLKSVTDSVNFEQEFIAHEALLVLVEDSSRFLVYQNGILVYTGKLDYISGSIKLRSYIDLRHKWPIEYKSDSSICQLRLSFARNLVIKLSKEDAKWLSAWINPAIATLKILPTMSLATIK